MSARTKSEFAESVSPEQKPFTQDEIAEVRLALNVAIDAVLAERGLRRRTPLGIRFGWTDFRMTLEVEKPAAAAVKREEDKTGWLEVCRIHGLPPDALGKTIQFTPKRRFVIVGGEPHRPKACVVVANGKGKRFVMSPGEVRALLGLQPMEAKAPLFGREEITAPGKER